MEISTLFHGANGKGTDKLNERHPTPGMCLLIKLFLSKEESSRNTKPFLKVAFFMFAYGHENNASLTDL